MPTFHSKPRTITAERFHADKAHDPKGVCRGGPACEEPTLPYNNWPHVHTVHGGRSVQLADGDWVVLEPDGVHYYPIKDDVMKANWELVEVQDQCQRCGRWFPFDQLTMVACEGVYCQDCLRMVEAGAETYECDGTNCPPRAHDHKVLI